MNISNIIAKLQADSVNMDSAEHILDSASRHVTDVDIRTKHSFKNAFDSISIILGKADFNCAVDTQSYKNKDLVSMPSWSSGKALNGDSIKTIKLAYWIKENITYYLVLRHEFADKIQKPIYFNVSIGFRKMNKRNLAGINSLKNTDLESPVNQNLLTKIFSWIK